PGVEATALDRVADGATNETRLKKGLPFTYLPGLLAVLEQPPGIVEEAGECRRDIGATQLGRIVEIVEYPRPLGTFEDEGNVVGNVSANTRAMIDALGVLDHHGGRHFFAHACVNAKHQRLL